MSSVPSPDRPLLWGPVHSGVSGLEPLPVHCPHAGGHCALHYCRSETPKMQRRFRILAEAYSGVHGYFRRSCCCDLHRHSADVCDDRWSHHPDNHGCVYGTFKTIPASMFLNVPSDVCVPHPQRSTRLVDLGTWSTCTAWQCPVKSFPTAPATYHARTPCICSGTPSPETCLGLA